VTRGRFWRDTVRRYVRNRAAVAGALVVAAVVAACLLIPVLSPHDPYAIDFTQDAQRPSPEHLLGTDLFGRDLLTRMALGGRTTLLVALGAVSLILAFGLVYGTIAGVAGRRLDELMMRVLDGLLALPKLPVMIIILVLVGLNANLWTLVFTLAIVNWMVTARLVRTQIRSLRQEQFVHAARAIGAGWRQIAFRHLTPNALGVLVVAVFLELPGVVLGEAFVSVLGLGVNPPDATWGNIAQEGIERGRLYLVVLPSVAIGLLAVAANFVADGLHDALDPRRTA
jgi:ABC-type dipeptide/oligopeptide/nickel transport system permease subunit